MQDTPPDRFNESPPVSSYAEVDDSSDTSSEPASFSYGIKTDSRTGSSVLLHFKDVAAETPKAAVAKIDPA